MNGIYMVNRPMQLFVWNDWYMFYFVGASIPSKWAEVEEGLALLKPVAPTFPVN